jgi:hypothetical protein
MTRPFGIAPGRPLKRRSPRLLLQGTAPLSEKQDQGQKLRAVLPAPHHLALLRHGLHLAIWFRSDG